MGNKLAATIVAELGDASQFKDAKASRCLCRVRSGNIQLRKVHSDKQPDNETGI
ncbi:hypothetical protein [Paenibacillus thiaminolyticus]|uniref:hypothetical protein n=1 Tax=Paenibacillus thiaminolyticus TaxID=49283 RepID=UPI002175EBD7|nr:hypothetical protein [Paenibacillus thiaminolyticus]